MPSCINIQRRASAAVLTIGGLDAKGLFTTATLQDLKRAIQDLQTDSEVRAIVLTGQGAVFCTGGNFGNASGARTVFAEAFKALVVAMAECRLPLVAAVNGTCTAGGMTLLGATDYAFALPDAKFGYVELTFGAFPMLALVTVPPHVPKKTFFSWAYKGQPVDAVEMLRLGLVNEIVPPELLWETVDAFVADLSSKSAAAIAAGRLLWYSTIDTPPLGHLDAAYRAVTDFGTVDHFK
jgi:enoyl-CoA hydratase/carnithine racemase